MVRHNAEMKNRDGRADNISKGMCALIRKVNKPTNLQDAFLAGRFSILKGTKLRRFLEARRLRCLRLLHLLDLSDFTQLSVPSLCRAAHAAFATSLETKLPGQIVGVVV